jgi:hypothetical protein
MFDDRKGSIRGLWKRNDNMYAGLIIVDEAIGHRANSIVPLEKTRQIDRAPLKKSPKSKDYGQKKSQNIRSLDSQSERLNQTSNHCFSTIHFEPESCTRNRNKRLYHTRKSIL